LKIAPDWGVRLCSGRSLSRRGRSPERAVAGARRVVRRLPGLDGADQNTSPRGSVVRSSQTSIRNPTMRIPIAAAIAVTVILSGCIPPPGPAGVVYDRPLPPRGVAPGPGYVWVNNRWVPPAPARPIPVRPPTPARPPVAGHIPGGVRPPVVRPPAQGPLAPVHRPPGGSKKPPVAAARPPGNQPGRPGLKPSGPGGGPKVKPKQPEKPGVPAALPGAPGPRPG